MSEDVIIKGEVGYNRQDPQAAPVFAFAGAIIVTLILCFVFVISYYGWALESEQYRFQQLPVAQDYKNIQSAEAQVLGQYGYINKERTAVRVPVDRAMELLLSESQAKKTFYSTAAAPVKADPAAAPGAAAPGAAAPAAAAPGATPAANNPAAKPVEAPKH
jgi:hypothetical protein